MKVDVIQTSFASGELSPSLYGRTDISQYANACEIVRNFLPRSYGSVISMPGTRYISTVSDSTLKTRLIPFVFNREDAYIIEMGDFYMRFYTDRGVITGPIGTETLTSLTANIIAQYTFNDNTNSTVVIDSAGSHNATSSSNTATMHSTGIVGSGSFDMGEQHYVRISDHADFSFQDGSGANPFSFAAWIYVVVSSEDQYIISKNGSNAREYDFYLNTSQRLVFRIWDENSDFSAKITTDRSLSSGKHLVICSYDSRGGTSAANGMNLWLDGELVTEVTRNTHADYVDMEPDNADVRIGVDFKNDSLQDYFKDKIDNVVFFNKVLTASDVSAFYTSQNTIFQLATVYGEDEIFDVQFAQLNDIIWMAHPSHPPQQLIRTSAAEWAIDDFDFTGGPFLDANTDAAVKLKPSGTSGTINVTSSTGVFTLSSSTVGHVGALFRIGGLAETNSTTGLEEYGYVRITDVISSLSATATVIKTLKSTTATDNWAEGAWSSVRGYPSCVHFSERRLWFARTNVEPEKLWGSKVFEYSNYALDTQEADDGLNIGLATNESNEILWLASSKSLAAGTFGGVSVVTAGSEDAITPDNVSASGQIRYGGNSVVPKNIGSYIYYVQRFGKKLRELTYSWDEDTHKALDRTILSPHILEDGCVDMGVQNNPESVLYCVLTSGALATFTREIDQEVAAWAKHTTDGTYTSIAIIPSQSYDYDEAWVIVERWINGVQKKYIEVFENIDVPVRQDKCLYLHSALTYDAYESTSTSNVTISLSASSGSVTLTSSSAYFNGAMINKKLRVINVDSGVTLGQGTITATASTTSITLSITTNFNALAYSAGVWGVSATSVLGLSHLEAKTVGILADGQTESLTRSVASGVVTLGSDYFVISIGLSYNQDIYTLSKEGTSQRGTSQGKFQRYNEIAFKVNRSTQNFKYGPDEDSLDDLSLAITPTVTTLYTGVLPPQAGGIAMRGGYKRGAQVYIRNSQPLPVEILNIIGTLETFEK